MPKWQGFGLLVASIGVLASSQAMARRHHHRRVVIKKTTLSIMCNVDGANYIIDKDVAGKEKRGMVSGNSIEITPGTHTIKLYKHGYLPYQDVFKAKKGQNVEIDATLILYFGWVTVISSPPGAEVIVDGAKKGVTPLTLELKHGHHTIVVGRKGFLSTTKKVTVKPGKSKELSVNLTPIPKAPVVKKKKWYKKAWVWTVIGVAVAGGVTTAVLLTRGGSQAPPTPNEQTSLSW